MGVKKSTVCTRASEGDSWYTPASSDVSKPTRTFALVRRGMRLSTWSKTFGLSLLAQPAALICAVSFRESDTSCSVRWRLLRNVLGYNIEEVPRGNDLGAEPRSPASWLTARWCLASCRHSLSVGNRHPWPKAWHARWAGLPGVQTAIPTAILFRVLVAIGGHGVDVEIALPLMAAPLEQLVNALLKRVRWALRRTGKYQNLAPRDEPCGALRDGLAPSLPKIVLGILSRETRSNRRRTKI